MESQGSPCGGGGSKSPTPKMFLGPLTIVCQYATYSLVVGCSQQQYADSLKTGVGRGGIGRLIKKKKGRLMHGPAGSEPGRLLPHCGQNRQLGRAYAIQWAVAARLSCSRVTGW